MQIEVSTLSTTKKNVQISVPADQVDRQFKAAYTQLQRRVTMPGFRRGKVPRKLLSRHYRDQLDSQVMNDLIQRAFQEEVQQMTYLGQPKVEADGITEGAEFSFSFIIEVEPEVSVARTEGIEVYFPPVAVDEDAVEARISALLSSKASLKEVEEDRVVQVGDTIMVAVKVLDGEGEVLDEAPGCMIQVGAESWYKGLDEALMGQSKEEDLVLDVDFPEDAVNGAVAGKSTKVEARIQAIHALKAPDLDDALAEELGYEGGADAMRTSLQTELEERAQESSRNQARVNLLQELVKENEFEVPEAMTQQFLEALTQELALQRAQRGVDVRKTPFTQEELQDLQGRATFAARAALILKHISQAESMEISEEEMDARLEEIAAARGQKLEAIKGYLNSESAMEQLRDRLLEEKTLDWLLERAVLLDAPPAAEEAEDAAE